MLMYLTWLKLHLVTGTNKVQLDKISSLIELEEEKKKIPKYWLLNGWLLPYSLISGYINTMRKCIYSVFFFSIHKNKKTSEERSVW